MSKAAAIAAPIHILLLPALTIHKNKTKKRLSGAELVTRCLISIVLKKFYLIACNLSN